MDLNYLAKSNSNEARYNEVLGCIGISWDICKQSAPCFKQITTTTPHYSVFTGRMLFLMPKQLQAPCMCVTKQRFRNFKCILFFLHLFIMPPFLIQQPAVDCCGNCSGVITHARLCVSRPIFLFHICKDSMHESVHITV